MGGGPLVPWRRLLTAEGGRPGGPGPGGQPSAGGFYVLLAGRFSLRIRHVSGHGARHSTRTLVTVLTALTIQLFEAEKRLIAFLRVSQRAFSPSRFLC